EPSVRHHRAPPRRLGVLQQGVHRGEEPRDGRGFRHGESLVRSGIVGYPRSAMTITCRLYKDGVLKEEAFDPGRVSELIEEEGARVWLDVEDPTDDELTMIGEEFSLHPLSVEDTRHRGQRPK